jgi:hypothetical protein
MHYIMKHRLPKAVIIIVSLLFISIILFLPHFFNPHFVLLGIFFIEGAEAALIYSLFILAALLLSYFVIKRFRKCYYPALSIYTALGVNAGINLIAAVFFSEDMQGFISRVFSSPDFFGAYILNQGVLFLLCLLIVMYMWANKQEFDRK